MSRKTVKLSEREYFDIRRNARAYVDAQLAVMRHYGDGPTLSRAAYWKLVSDCAAPSIELALYRKRQEAK